LFEALVIVPKLLVVPTAPVNVAVPVPVPNVKFLSVASAAFTVLEKVIVFAVVVNVGSAVNVTAPV
jgi:hypothetical protein